MSSIKNFLNESEGDIKRIFFENVSSYELSDFIPVIPIAFKEFISGVSEPVTIETKEIPVSSLVGTQQNVFKDNLNKLLENKSKVFEKPIIVTNKIKIGNDIVIDNSHYYIIDGHHRAALAVLLKRKNILAKICDIEQYEL